MSSPTVRTLAYIRKFSMEAEVVERFNSFTKQRKDLFGFIDIVAVDPALNGCLGIQATDSTSVSKRRTKILSLNAAHMWLKASNRIWVVGWSKKVKVGSKPSKKTGKRPKVWTPTVSVVTLEDFE